MKKISLKYYKPAETAKETGDYYCHVCGNESGTNEIKFKEGEKFGVCQNCGKSTLWIKK